MKRRSKSGKKFILVLIIAVIMIFSVLGLYRGDEDSSDLEYNGFEFFKTDRGYSTFVDGRYYNFDYLPHNLTEIEVNFGNWTIDSQKIYMAYDPVDKDNLIEYSMSKVYGVLTSKGLRVVAACMSEENCPDIPLVDCDSVTKIIYFKKSEDFGIYKDKSCLVLECSEESCSMVADLFNYLVLGVI